MKPALTLVRDALPMDRISCARIRQWLADHRGLGDWSRGRLVRSAAAAAALIRDRIWESHDVTLGTVRDRLDRQLSTGAELVVYWVRLEVEIEPDKDIEVVSRTSFTLAPSGRLRAEIGLVSPNGEPPITEGPVPLRRRETG